MAEKVWHEHGVPPHGPNFPPDPEDGWSYFYVSLEREDRRWRILSGPHETRLAALHSALGLAKQLDLTVTVRTPGRIIGWVTEDGTVLGA